MFRKKIHKEIREIEIQSTLYKISIFYENRKNSRVSITKTGINIRVAKALPKNMQNEQINKFILWAEQTIREKGVVFARNMRIFEHGSKLELYDKTVTLSIKNSETKRVSGKITKDKIEISLSVNLNKELKDIYISKMVAKLLAKNYKQKISDKLNEFNRQFQFGEINTIRLKNNRTNWGSCSSNNNINISVRLLLAPEFAVNYVLIHELCHLKHRNHSKNFWNLVAACCPNYLQAESWLKKNSSRCIV